MRGRLGWTGKRTCICARNDETLTLAGMRSGERRHTQPVQCAKLVDLYGGCLLHLTVHSYVCPLCVQCLPGSFALRGFAACLACAAGSSSPAGASACVYCQPGTASTANGSCDPVRLSALGWERSLLRSRAAGPPKLFVRSQSSGAHLDLLVRT